MNNIKIGDIFYKAEYIFNHKNNRLYIYLEEWIVRSIRRPNYRGYYRFLEKKVYIIKKNNKTWKKDSGFVKYIPNDCRLRFDLHGPLPKGISKTKIQALKYLKRFIKKHETQSLQKELIPILNKKIKVYSK